MTLPMLHLSQVEKRFVKRLARRPSVPGASMAVATGLPYLALAVYGVVEGRAALVVVAGTLLVVTQFLLRTYLKPKCAMLVRILARVGPAYAAGAPRGTESVSVNGAGHDNHAG